MKLELDSDSEPEFKVNTKFANSYNTWREKEELQKIKDRYGSLDVIDESSSSEEEDEDAQELTCQVEKDWLKTLAALKSKDPKIYDKNNQFFEQKETSSSDEDVTEVKIKKKKSKPMHIKDYDRTVILQNNGNISDTQLNQKSFSTNNYRKEQEMLKKSLLSAVSNESDDELLTKRVKTKEELKGEEDDYLEWLKGENEDVKINEKIGIELDSLKDYWNNPHLESNEKFLRDYILNKDYIDKSELDEERIPSYEEIVQDYSDDENNLNKQDEFERKFNFRYEEPDEEFIKSYPRTITSSLRQKDERRKNKRLEKQKRKKMEKEKMKQEINHLKNLKRKEILRKIEELKKVTGDDNITFEPNSLESDFNVEAHDEMMQKIFNEEYYEVNEDDKPEYTGDNEDLLDENYDAWLPENYSELENELHCEDEGFNMDADFIQNIPVNNDSNLQKKSCKKKKSKFKDVIDVKKPVFNPNDKTFEEYLDEYYKLDYEDLIDDLPCRFKYRNVVSNSFGLSTDEVLYAKDKELNRWVSLRKMSQYRSENEEKIDKKIFQKKCKNPRKKINILPSLYSSQNECEETKPETSFQQKTDQNRTSSEISNHEHHKNKRVSSTNPKQKHKKFKKLSHSEEISDSRLKAYGIDPRIYKYKIKKDKNNKQK